MNKREIITNLAVIDGAIQKLAVEFLPEKIILFGSQARGNADTHSDVDLLVICPFQGSRRKLLVTMNRALREFDFAKDLVVYTPEEYEKNRAIPGTIARSASLEGKVLYERH